MILLDTHVLLMLALRPERLSRSATRAIGKADAGGGNAISSITLWEIALLIHEGRVVVLGSAETFLKEISRRPRLFTLGLSPEIAALAFQLPADFPKDPADRIIAATAWAHGLALVTKDQHLQECSLLQTIW